MKRTIAMILALAFMFGLCVAAYAQDKEEKKLVEIDSNTITVRDDGTGLSDSKEGMEKTVVLTNRNIGYKGQSGPFVFEVEGIQIAKLVVTDEDTAFFLDLEPGKEVTLVSIQMSVENTSNENLTFFPYTSTIVTSDKEQVMGDWLLSDEVGGEFKGNVVKQGQIYWFCNNTNADNLTHLRWIIEAPHDRRSNEVGEEVVIEFNLPKG